ncbi:MAG: AAA family ATPase [Solirubrobacterales bacterium]|nr:AAA family ATPase [Solirubrobacterales bacterium]
MVSAHGGTVEKFIGDAVMAVFGLPTAHGDDASRAVSAALELRDRVRAEPLLADALPIRIGLNTGEVVASREAETGGDFLITGDAVNVAARLQQGAGIWSIVAGERTARAAPGFSFGPLQVVDARGKAEPVRAADVLGRASIERRPLPLLGREPDLAQLELVARRSFEEQRPFLVTVIAPAGTGKSRLLEEFLERLQRSTPECVVAIAQCLPYGQRLTFWPLRAILHRLVGTSEDAPQEDLRADLVGWLESLGMPDPGSTAALLLATIGAGEGDVADRVDLLAAWRDTLELAAARRPLVVVFEDLHWSSDSFLDLVEHVTQPHGDARLLMLVLSRGELLDRRPTWGGGRRNHVSLALEPLDRPSIGGLVQHLLESASEEVVDAVAARAEGNPFYAGEIVRSILDRAGPRASPADVQDALARLPDTVQATVLARLDGLPASERRVLQLGAVFGRSFLAGGVTTLEPTLGPDLEGTLAALVDREMVRRTGGDLYTFRHILIREVAYGTLPRSERARLHAAAGHWLEELATQREDAYAELIAYHYREAAALSTFLAEPQAALVKVKAVEWLRRAAETAGAAGADVEARRHLTSALEWADGAELSDIHELIGDTYVGGDATISAYETAYRLASEAGRSPDDRLRLLSKLIEYEARFQGSVGGRRSLESMDALAAEGRALLRQVTDDRARSRIHIGLSFLPFWRRSVGAQMSAAEIARAEEDARLGLAYAERVDDAPLMSAALDGIGSLAMDRGDWAESRTQARTRLGFKERLNHPERLDAYSVATWTSTVLGDLADADRVSSEALATVQAGQAPGMSLHLVAWRAEALFCLGRWDEAVTAAERAEALWRELGQAATGYGVRAFLAAFDVARARADGDAVERWRAIVRAILQQFGAQDAARRLAFHYIALEVDALARELEEEFAIRAPDRRGRSIGLCVDHGVSIDEGALRQYVAGSMEERTALLEGHARRALGQQSSDGTQLERALVIFERCAAVPYAARVRTELGRLTGNEEMVAAGIGALEALGDVDQIDRYRPPVR